MISNLEKRMKIRNLTTVLALAGIFACGTAQAVQRVFVSSSGSDANTATNCGFSAPCRGFTAAMTVVDSGGEVVALDAAGYGAVTITKSVTIVANPGFYAGITASTGNAVTIATASVQVTLRGLNINGVGAQNGVVMTNGARLSIENCVISNFGSGAGVLVNTAAKVRVTNSLIRENSNGILLKGGADTVIANTTVLGNSNAGVEVYSETASAITTAAVNDSVFSGNAIGIYAYETTASALSRIGVNRSTMANGTFGVVAEFGGGPAVVMVGGSMIMNNSVGFAALGGGGATLETFGNNIARMNGPDSGTISTVSLR